MPSNTSSKCSTQRLATSILVACLLSAASCAHVNDPWRDSSMAVNEDMKTPSSEAYQKGLSEIASMHGRTWDSSCVSYHNEAISHWPLWFEDPFEDKGNSLTPPVHRDDPDNQFTWNAADYLHMAYGPARQFVNLVAWPISATVTPPGTLMESDGRIDKGILWYDHDAKRADSVTREPPDVAMLAPPYSHPENQAAAEPAADSDH